MEINSKHLSKKNNSFPNTERITLKEFNKMETAKFLGELAGQQHFLWKQEL